jgi:hypothetical protein
MTITVITIFHLFSPPLIPNVKCIAWNFDRSNFVGEYNKDLKSLRFENGASIPDMESYFITNYE